MDICDFSTIITIFIQDKREAYIRVKRVGFERHGINMLNYIWAFMILLGIIYGTITGNMESLTNAAMDSAGEAVSLCITMLGVMALWMGLMEIAKNSGLIAKLTRGIQPFVSFMFPKIPKEHVAREYISTNLIANILGLGWACTPAGLKAMEALSKLEQERGNTEFTKKRAASNEMCTFLVLNISSLQLIPVNMIAYRQQYGSTSPAAVIAPALLATALSTVAAVVYCKVRGKG